MGLSGGSRDVDQLDPVGPREPLLFRRRSDREQLARSLTIAIASSVVVFGGLAWIVTNSPGWENVQESFLDPAVFADALPDVIAAFWVNVRLFLIAEVLILVFGLLLAVVRALPGPALFPLRLMATVYTDVFRAMIATETTSFSGRSHGSEIGASWKQLQSRSVISGQP